MSKLTIWILGALLMAVGVLSVLYSCQRHSVEKAKADLGVYKEAATTLSTQLENAHQSFRFDLDAIQGAQASKEAIVLKSTEVKEKVDAVAKKVKAGQITSDAADAAYIDSMWETYCERQSDSACGSRSPSH